MDIQAEVNQSNLEVFRKNLGDSRECMEIAADIFRFHKIPVYMPEERTIAFHEDWTNFQDHVDLVIFFGGTRRTVRINQTPFVFDADEKQWPADDGEHPATIVCPKELWDEMKYRPYCFMQFSADRKYYLVIYPKMEYYWTEAPYADDRYTGQGSVNCYFCPIDRVMFKKVEQDGE